MATNGFGNGFSPQDMLFGGHKGDDLADANFDKMLGDAVALRIALRILLPAIPGKIAEEIADGIGEAQRDMDPVLVAIARGKGPWAVSRYRSFSQTTDEIIKGLRARGARHRS